MKTPPRTLDPNLRLRENVITDWRCGSADRKLASLAQSPGFSSQHFIKLNWGRRVGGSAVKSTGYFHGTWVWFPALMWQLLF